MLSRSSSNGNQWQATQATLRTNQLRNSSQTASQVRSRVGASDNLKIHKHFVAASTGSPTRIRFSQPNSKFSRHLAEQTSSATAPVQAK
jgi:hypothetical protein